MDQESQSLHKSCLRFSYNLGASEGDAFAFQSLRQQGCPKKIALNIVGSKKCKLDNLVNNKGMEYNLVLSLGQKKIYTDIQNICEEDKKESLKEESKKNKEMFDQLQKWEGILEHKKMKSFSTVLTEDDNKYGILQIPTLDRRIAKVQKINKILETKYNSQKQFFFQRQKFVELANQLYQKRIQKQPGKFNDILDPQKFFPDLLDEPQFNNVKIMNYHSKITNSTQNSPRNSRR